MLLIIINYSNNNNIVSNNNRVQIINLKVKLGHNYNYT